jgi:hypothetical protein
MCKFCNDGFRNWHERIGRLVASSDISGLEKVVVVCVHFLHVCTGSGWLKFCLDPTTQSPTLEQMRPRDRAIELYVLFECLVLAGILWLPDKIHWYEVAVAAFILFEILLNLSSIIFVGKLKDVYPPTHSIERSVLLFGVNVLQVIMIFAIFYRAAFGLPPSEAAVNSALVFGTVGYPSPGGYVVAVQVIVDFVLLAIFLGTFVGNLGALRRLPDSSSLAISIADIEANITSLTAEIASLRTALNPTGAGSVNR